MLYHFEQFPYFSIIYNLIFPFMISLSMLLLILGLTLPFLPIIHTINSHLTEFILNFAYNMPTTVDYKFQHPGLSFDGMVIYLTLLFCLGVLLKWQRDMAAEERLDFAYL